MSALFHRSRLHRVGVGAAPRRSPCGTAGPPDQPARTRRTAADGARRARENSQRSGGGRRRAGPLNRRTWRAGRTGRGRLADAMRARPDSLRARRTRSRGRGAEKSADVRVQNFVLHDCSVNRSAKKTRRCRRETPTYTSSTTPLHLSRRRRHDFPFLLPDDPIPTSPFIADPHRFDGTKGHEQATLVAPHAEANSSLEIPSLLRVISGLRTRSNPPKRAPRGRAADSPLEVLPRTPSQRRPRSNTK